MNFTMITPYHNHDHGYICLILKDFAALPQTVQVKGKTLHKKSEFHVSLLCIKNLLPIIQGVQGTVTEEDLERDFLAYQEQTPLDTSTFTGELRYVKRGERETIVAMVEVPGIEDLFRRLSAKYAVALPVQPTHITLYTLQPEAGIGILSQEELKRDSQPIAVPEIML